jgi:hypothetical protein
MINIGIQHKNCALKIVGWSGKLVVYEHIVNVRISGQVPYQSIPIGGP